MAETTLLIPASGINAPASWLKTDTNGKLYVRKQISDKLIEIYTKYKTFIDKYSRTSRIPPAMLVALIYVESGGNAKAIGGGGTTIGLMQWSYKPGYADAVIKREFDLGRMSTEETEALVSIGKRLGFTYKDGKISRNITQADAMDPSFNILVGSMYLGQYADSIVGGKKTSPEWGVTDGKVNLDRMILHYNRGENSADAKLSRSGQYKTSAELHKAVTSTTGKDYIAKIMGKNGLLDIILTDHKDTIPLTNA